MNIQNDTAAIVIKTKSHINNLASQKLSSPSTLRIDIFFFSFIKKEVTLKNTMTIVNTKENKTT